MQLDIYHQGAVSDHHVDAHGKTFGFIETVPDGGAGLFPTEYGMVTVSWNCDVVTVTLADGTTVTQSLESPHISRPWIIELGESTDDGHQVTLALKLRNT